MHASATRLSASSSIVEKVRRFNRFYTTQIGVLREAFGGPYSLTEVRVLYELAHRDRPTAGELVKDLGLDPGYLSRIIRSFELKKMVSRTGSKTDARQQLLSLTAKGRLAFNKLEARTNEEIAGMLGRLTSTEQQRVAQSMEVIEGVLGTTPESKVPFLLRAPRAGDFGWVVHRHGALYAQEYGWDVRFEALVAEIVGQFAAHFDPKREQCWIAERNDEIVGSVFLVKKSTTVAKLRLLYVEPSARGFGIGAKLVDECVLFARQARYKKITLWTQSNLHAARHLYKNAGFTLVDSTPQTLFGFDLVSETWDLKL